MPLLFMPTYMSRRARRWQRQFVTNATPFALPSCAGKFPHIIFSPFCEFFEDFGLPSLASCLPIFHNEDSHDATG
jgi:hypothetical protein